MRRSGRSHPGHGRHIATPLNNLLRVAGFEVRLDTVRTSEQLVIVERLSATVVGDGTLSLSGHAGRVSASGLGAQFRVGAPRLLVLTEWA